ncbi:MAG: hypothetical protein NZM26_00945 [Patescibacteria group bacterium]|nr:hypothetical protein [Patescibacteria group bacterium]MCX7928071.1 hypothetical protein [Patescibacteria group bacterium]
MMYETKQTNYLYLFIFVCFSLAFGMLVFFYYKPMIINAQCSDVASKSSFIYKDRNLIDPTLNYDSLKEKCIQEAL